MELVDTAQIDFGIQQRMSSGRQNMNSSSSLTTSSSLAAVANKKTAQEQLKFSRIHRHHRQQYSNGGSNWTDTEG